MEQIIDTFGIDWKIILIQMVNFSILLGVLWYVLYRPLIKLIEKRRAQIIKGVADAERAEAALKDADSKKSEILAEASMEAEKIITASKETAKKKEAEILKEGKYKYDRLLTEAKLKAEEIKREALEESREELAKLIVLGVEKTIRKKTGV